MKRLLPAFGLLLVGLTACPQNPPTPPPVLAVPSDAAVLNGVWQGTVRQTNSGNLYTRSPDAVYRAVFERRTESPYSSYQPSLLVQRLGSGEALQRLKLTREPQALGYRAAQGSVPARLLVGYGGDGQVVIEERDPQTLAVASEWSYAPQPAATPTSYSAFSLDGTRFAGRDGRLVDTVTHASLPLHPAVQTQLANPPQPSGMVAWSGDFTWLKVDTYVAGLFGGAYRYDYVSNVSGRRLGGEPQHAIGCGLSGTDTFAREAVSLPDGGVALTYADGVVELRRADGTLRQAVSLGDCSAFGFLSTGTTLEVENYSGKAASIRVSEGAVQPGPAATPKLPGLSVKLDTAARYVSESTYESSGTATVDGQTYAFTATATGQGITFRAQTSPIPHYVRWAGELRRADGTLYARAYGIHDATPNRQGLTLELEDVDVGFSFYDALGR